MKTLTIMITPAQFAAKEAELNTQGITVAGNKGEILKSGVDLEYSYDGTGVLIINIEKKPFFTSEASIEKKILAWFQS